MSIRYCCEECGAAMKIRDSLAGTRGRCPKCRTKFDVPAQSTLSESEYAELMEQQGQDNVTQESGTALQGKSEAPSGTSLEPVSSPKLPETTPPAKPKQPSSVKLPAAPAAPPSASPPPLPKSAPAPAPVAASPEVPPSAPPAAADAEPDETLEEADEESFDAAEFLLDDSDPNAKKTAGLAKKPLVADDKPAVDALGRRYYGNAPKKAAAASEPDDDVGASVTTTATLPPVKERVKIDWVALRKQLVKKSPFIALIPVLAVIAYFVASRYLAPGIPMPRLAQIQGQVQVNGKPMGGVTVHLTPLNATEAKSVKDLPIRLTDSVGVTDDSGTFRMTYLGQPGSPLGKARIWLEPLHPADFKLIPAKYQAAGSDIRDVREAGNDGKFDLVLKLE
ncbi:hypothetical protein [Planctomicrobium sp. SH527]|uniref:hypothetical protein n=1 Tax=Planctomicrobium sp. SH527 TaxID=3448123 RepID=UPI003F5AF9F4